MAALDDARACVPDLNAVMMLRVGTSGRCRCAQEYMRYESLD